MELIADVCFWKKLAYSVGLQEVISRCWSLLRSRSDQRMELESVSCCRRSLEQRSHNNGNDAGEVTISREDVVEVIMPRLGLRCDLKREKSELSAGEIRRMFEEEEASMEEVKEAFDVFDENQDGFIDAQELQRVLSMLGFKEATEIQRCSLMIKAFDQNGDGKIDLDEFSGFMENCL